MARVRLHGRTGEVQRLEAAWAQAVAGRPQLVTVTGRKRVGKTFLLAHLAAGRRALLFGATHQAEAAELGRLITCVRRQLGAAAAESMGGMSSWEDALSCFVALAEEAPLLVVLDGLPQLARSSPDLPAVIARTWDTLPPSARLMLVVTGAGTAAAEPLACAGGALANRATAGIHLDIFTMAQARTILPRLRPTEFLEAYAACGGYPLHLQQWDQEATTEENLLALAGTTGGILLESAAAVLREELPDAGGYMRILAAVGRGKTRYSQIVTEVDQRIEHPIEVLVRTGLLRRNTPLGVTPTARITEYEIADTYLDFWFSVLYSMIPEIEAGDGPGVLRSAQPVWQRHLAEVFKQGAREHARELVVRGDLPGDVVVGRWWAPTPDHSEVDVLGLQGDRSYLVGEAAWSDRQLEMGDVLSLHRAGGRVPRPVEDPVYALWGPAGVSREVIRSGVRGFGLGAVLGEEAS